MKFISLLDLKTQHILTIDAKGLVFRLEIDGSPKEIRLKPSYMADILYALFNKHPTVLSYSEITEILKAHHLAISDLTRMHRKVSEIRTFLEAFHPSLKELIFNTRGVGYSLPLSFKNLHHLEPKTQTDFRNPKFTQIMSQIHTFIEDAVELTEKGKIIKQSQGYVIDRQTIRDVLSQKIEGFNALEKILLQELRLHEADFMRLRIEYSLSKLKTYIGLARISEYPISQTQWIDWFQQEVWFLFEELKKLVKHSEIV